MLGTAGHVDHGKTALVKLLTGCETDTLAEEKERGLTIDLGFAPCRLADARKITPLIDQMFPLAEARQAFQRSLSRHPAGKIVLQVAED